MECKCYITAPSELSLQYVIKMITNIPSGLSVVVVGEALVGDALVEVLVGEVLVEDTLVYINTDSISITNQRQIVNL